jgi:site-specific DNA-methyltransferase (adenine-specific)
MTYELHLGDCLEVLRGMPADSIDSIVTDPPYGLSFMGKKWDYDVPSTEIWTECLRVLKPGGHLLAFAGTRTQHRMAVRIEDAGFEIRDMIAWVYGSGFPKSHNGPWGGTALKPALEPITVARKPLIGTVAQNTLEYGTGALNIDGCRIEAEPMPANTGGGGLPRRSDCEHRGPGVVTQPHALGRWPANIIHDGSDEVLEAFPDAPGQQGDLKETGRYRPSSGRLGDMEPPRAHLARDKRSGSTSFAIQAGARREATSAARFFYCAKTTKVDRNDGCEDLPQRQGGLVSDTSGQHITRRDEGYAPPAQGNNHPTVKPTDLMAYLLRLVTPADGTALDPFMGSGSTGKAAMLEGFNFIGIEQDAAYMAIATVRIAHAEAKSQMQQAEQQLQEQQLNLFSA